MVKEMLSHAWEASHRGLKSQDLFGFTLRSILAKSSWLSQAPTIVSTPEFVPFDEYVRGHHTLLPAIMCSMFCSVSAEKNSVGEDTASGQGWKPTPAPVPKRK